MAFVTTDSPTAKSSWRVAPAVSRSPVPIDSREGVLTGLHILVVENDRDAGEVFGLPLSYFGAAITSARNLPAALRVMAHIAPSVVISDMLLGSQDRLGLIVEARMRGVRAPFIAVSTQDLDRTELQRAGFAAYLRKPVDDTALVDTILALMTVRGPACELRLVASSDSQGRPLRAPRDGRAGVQRALGPVRTA
jgi:CheY-like chemotaxis protein